MGDNGAAAKMKATESVVAVLQRIDGTKRVIEEPKSAGFAAWLKAKVRGSDEHRG